MHWTWSTLGTFVRAQVEWLVTWVHWMCSEFPGDLPWVRFTVRVLASDEEFLKYSGAPSTRWLYCRCTARCTYLHSSLGSPGLKCGGLMRIPVLQDADEITWSPSYVFKVGIICLLPHTLNSWSLPRSFTSLFSACHSFLKSERHLL